jgi:mono/diheme cytochrome c family protein
MWESTTHTRATPRYGICSPALAMRLPAFASAGAPLAALGLLFGLGMTACGTDTSDPTEVARATWYQDVAPILSKHCMSCHQDGGIAPFSLTDVDHARDYAVLAAQRVDQGVMPPFDAREETGCAPRFGWVDDPRLSAAEKQTLHDWIDDGYALGDEQAIPAPPSTSLPGVTRTIQPAAPFVSQGSRDQFTCFVLDPGAAQLSWLTGLQVRPGNAKVVHHVVLSEVQAGPDLTQLVTDHGIGQPFNCDQMATPSQFIVSIWTPGNQPMQTPSQLAVPIFAGAKLVMQIHYHPAGAINDPDTTAVDLRFSPIVPQKVYFISAFGNESQAPNLLPDPDDAGVPQFVVPRNAGDHVEHMRRTITSLGMLSDVRVFSINPHMHLVGTHIAGRIERPAARGSDPQTECLANGGWNFDWQRTYIYDTPLAQLPSVAVGDTLDLTCHWNNTIANPFVQRMLNDSHLPPQPVDISLGEQTTNEMCLEILGLAVTIPPQMLTGGAPDPQLLATSLAGMAQLR